MITNVVKISQCALLEILMSGITAYEIEKRSNEECEDTSSINSLERELFVETGGHIWGYVNMHSNGFTVHQIEHFSVSAFATRKMDSFAEHAKEEEIKRQFMSFLHPELNLLGDFHTHPYSKIKEVKDTEGWEPSLSDRQYWLHHSDQKWISSSNSPVFLVLTICKDNNAPTTQKHISQNTIQFGLCGFRFWLTAIVGDVSSGRKLSRNRSAKVGLWPLPIQSLGVNRDALCDYDPV